MRQKRTRGEPVSADITSRVPKGVPHALDGAAHSCGATFALVRSAHTLPLRGTSVTVEAECYRCSGCGETRFDFKQLDQARAAAAEKLNESEGLLNSTEIRELRADLGLTQAQFEQALGLGAKTMVRWETGRVLPSQAMALLLLLIRRDPSAMEFLAGSRHSSSSNSTRRVAKAL